MHLAGKTAVVTGGGSGIGAATAWALAGAGCRVLICGRRSDALTAIAARHAGTPPIITRATDVTARGAVDSLFAWVKQEMGPIDILVNAAGVNTKARMMGDMPPEKWDEIMAINATGPYNCIRAVLPEMRARGDGLIVNISSISGKRASMLGGVAYCASKFAMTALGAAVGLEVGKEGVRVTNVFPGEVDTPILEQRPQPVSETHRARILQPEDVAAAVLAVATLPPRAHIPELIIKPTWQDYA